LNTRLREIRKISNLTQSEFGKLIGLSPSIISDIEKGRRNLTDRNISIICEKFNISEVWLREGLGNKEGNKPTRSKILTFADYVDNLDKSSFLKLLMESVAELSDEQLEQMEEIGQSILHNIKQKKSNE